MAITDPSVCPTCGVDLRRTTARHLPDCPPPNTESIRDDYAMPYLVPLPNSDGVAERQARFDAWRVKHDAEVASDHLADLSAAKDRETRIRAAHQLVHLRPCAGADLKALCVNDGHDYPCPTIRILDGNE